MFGDLNTVYLLGNITNDIIVRYMPNGRPVANFGMATNRRYKVADSNEWKDQATFHNISMFGNQVEMFSQRAKKGTRVMVTGYIQTRNWQDKEGKTQYRTEVVVDRLILIDRYERGPASEFTSGGAANKGEQTDESFSGEESGAANPAPAPKMLKKKGPKDENVIDPDDLPF